MPTDTPLLTTTPTVSRILYKQIVPGDLLKFQAQSNISDSGGGARDLRFGAFTTIEDVVREIFPNVVQVVRSRKGSKVLLDVYRGRFYWIAGDGTEQSCEVDFEPPTDARPTEGRIARVHEIPCFSLDRIPNLDSGNIAILLFVQMSDGTVWPYFTDNTSLAQDGWDPQVARHILSCIAAERGITRAVIGYKDFTTDRGYCNGN